jgi:rhodanese-related sulfurtransferase
LPTGGVRLNIEANGEPELFAARTMNSDQPTMSDPQPRSACAVSRQAGAILAAAVALGLVYNSASPLGLRLHKSAENLASALASTNASPIRPVTTAASTVSTPTNTTSAATTPASAEFIPMLTWVQVKPLLAAGKIVLVDGRTSAAYQVEHIPGAISLSVKSPPADFAAFAANYPTSTNVVVYCGSDMCELSHELAVKLVKEMGFTNVQEMPGGITEYIIFEGKPNPSEPK